MKKTALVVSVVALLSFCSYFITEAKEVTREICYVVEPNDTLWDIAKAHNFENEDVRKIIYEIKEYNGIETEIFPGQSILIPVK